MIENIVSVLYEYRLELAAAFSVFDTNGDGTISAEEFTKTVQSLTSLTGASCITEMQAMELLKALDTNGDGHISYTEFVEGFKLADTSGGVAVLGGEGSKGTVYGTPRNPPSSHKKAAGH